MYVGPICSFARFMIDFLAMQSGMFANKSFAWQRDIPQSHSQYVDSICKNIRIIIFKCVRHGFHAMEFGILLGLMGSHSYWEFVYFARLARNNKLTECGWSGCATIAINTAAMHPVIRVFPKDCVWFRSKLVSHAVSSLFDGKIQIYLLLKVRSGNSIWVFEYRAHSKLFQYPFHILKNPDDDSSFNAYFKNLSD